MDAITIITSVISTIVFIFVDAVLLMLTAMIFKVPDKTYKTALKITAIVLGINWFLSTLVTLAFGITAESMVGADFQSLLPQLGAYFGFLIVLFLINIALVLYFVKLFYRIDWGKATLVMLVYKVFTWIVNAILGLILGLFFLAIGLVSLGTL